MQERVGTRTNDRKNGHGLGGTVNGRSPFLAEQKKNRRDQGAGVADTHPPYEIGDVPTPIHRLVQTPNPYPRKKQVGDRYQPEAQGRQGNGKSEVPPFGRFGLDGFDNILGDLGIGCFPSDQRSSCRGFEHRFSVKPVVNYRGLGISKR